MKKTQYDVSAETFVAVWQKSNSVAEAATTLGMPRSIASARACGYRRLGVPLKRMTSGSPKLEVEKLKQLANSFLAASDDNLEKEPDSDQRFPF